MLGTLDQLHEREVLVAELGVQAELGREAEFEAQHVCWEETSPVTDRIKMLSSDRKVKKVMSILEFQVEALGSQGSGSQTGFARILEM